jgi:VanZ family protein
MTAESDRDVRYLSYLMPPVLWALTIFVGSSIPAMDFPDADIFKVDKLIHLIIYLIFACLIYRALGMEGVPALLGRHRLTVTFLIVAVYGASDEFHQYFVPGRSMEFFDWVADASGAIVWILVVTVYKRFTARRT